MWHDCSECDAVASTECECCGEHICAQHEYLHGTHQTCAVCGLKRCLKMTQFGFCADHGGPKPNYQPPWKRPDIDHTKTRALTLVRSNVCGQCSKTAVGECPDCGGYCADHDSNHFEFNFCKNCNEYVCKRSMEGNLCVVCASDLITGFNCSICGEIITRDQFDAGGICGACTGSAPRCLYCDSAITAKEFDTTGLCIECGGNGPRFPTCKQCNSSLISAEAAAFDGLCRYCRAYGSLPEADIPPICSLCTVSISKHESENGGKCFDCRRYTYTRRPTLKCVKCGNYHSTLKDTCGYCDGSILSCVGCKRYFTKREIGEGGRCKTCREYDMYSNADYFYKHRSEPMSKATHTAFGACAGFGSADEPQRTNSSVRTGKKEDARANPRHCSTHKCARCGVHIYQVEAGAYGICAGRRREPSWAATATNAFNELALQADCKVCGKRVAVVCTTEGVCVECCARVGEILRKQGAL